jgi:hypothetical protein
MHLHRRFSYYTGGSLEDAFEVRDFHQRFTLAEAKNASKNWF